MMASTEMLFVHLVSTTLSLSHFSNAYFYGFGSQKRIVLYDTLSKKLLSPSTATPTDETNGCSLEEIVAILAHELGHWKLWHTFFNLAIVQAHLFCFFFFLGGMLNSDAMYSSFGFKGEKAVVMGLILFSNIISPVDHIIQARSVQSTHIPPVPSPPIAAWPLKCALASSHASNHPRAHAQAHAHGDGDSGPLMVVAAAAALVVGVEVAVFKVEITTYSLLPRLSVSHPPALSPLRVPGEEHHNLPHASWCCNHH